MKPSSEVNKNNENKLLTAAYNYDTTQIISLNLKLIIGTY